MNLEIGMTPVRAGISSDTRLFVSDNVFDLPPITAGC